MPTEHPTIRCPKCGAGAIDVAPDFDPLELPDWAVSSTVQAHCANGHEFFSTNDRDAGKKAVAVGTPEWDAHVAARA